MTTQAFELPNGWQRPLDIEFDEIVKNAGAVEEIFLWTLYYKNGKLIGAKTFDDERYTAPENRIPKYVKLARRNWKWFLNFGR